MICLRRSRDSSSWSSDIKIWVVPALLPSTCESSHCCQPFLDPSPWAWPSDFTSSRGMWWKGQHATSEKHCTLLLALLLGICSGVSQLPCCENTQAALCRVHMTRNSQGGTSQGGAILKWPCRPVRPKVTTAPNNILTPAWDRPHTRITQLNANWPVNTVWDGKCLLLF